MSDRNDKHHIQKARNGDARAFEVLENKFDDVIALAREGKGQDKFGYRAEFIQMVRLAKSLAGVQLR